MSKVAFTRYDEVLDMPDTNRLRILVRFIAGIAAVALFIAGCGGGGTSGPEDDPDLLFQENFNEFPDNAFPTDWTLLTMEAATEEGPAEWKVIKGSLHQSSNVQAPPTSGLPYDVNYEGTMALYDDGDWSNILFQADITPHDDDGIGVIFRWEANDVDDDGNFYRFLMVNDAAAGGPRVRVDRKVDGVWNTIREELSTELRYNQDQRYRVQIEMVLTQFTIKLDGTILFEFIDSSITGGKIGFFCYAEQGADFDNVQVFRRGP